MHQSWTMQRVLPATTAKSVSLPLPSSQRTNKTILRNVWQQVVVVWKCVRRRNRARCHPCRWVRNQADKTLDGPSCTCRFHRDSYQEWMVFVVVSEWKVSMERTTVWKSFGSEWLVCFWKPTGCSPGPAQYHCCSKCRWKRRVCKMRENKRFVVWTRRRLS